MVSLDKIREDLREVRYYYTRKELFDETFIFPITKFTANDLRRTVLRTISTP